MKREDMSNLARYNSEVARGLMHQPAWIDHMGDLQRQFNEEYKMNQETRWDLRKPFLRMPQFLIRLFTDDSIK